MSEPMNRTERNALVERIQAIEAELYPEDEEREPKPVPRARLKDTLYAVLGEYSDRLPRIPMSTCPFTGARLLRAWDPYGFDGPWWHKDRVFTPEEPAPPDSFRVLLGALDLCGREPAEAVELVLAGPGAPYVVPSLLEHPGMVAVISRIEMATGDIAYPIAYFSREEIDSDDLHQFWTRPELWFKNPETGEDGWIIVNDSWDFELGGYLEKGNLRWVAPDDPKGRVLGAGDGPCPFVGLKGPRQPQVLAEGICELEDPPDDTVPQPFDDN